MDKKDIYIQNILYIIIIIIIIIWSLNTHFRIKMNYNVFTFRVKFS